MRFLSRACVAAAIFLPWCVFFLPVLASDATFAIRDSGHFYNPFYEYVQQRWTDGTPLWNDREELGRPLLADATAAVFYPGKLLFTLSASYQTLYELYVSAHLLVAAFGAYAVTRRLSLGDPAGCLAAVVYAYGGGVLFLYSNVIFLIGAAWMPWVLATGRAIRSGGSIVPCAVSLAMMILGGDLETAYLVSVGAIAASALPVWRQRTAKNRWRQSLANSADVVFLRRIVTAILLAAMLSAIQWMPAAAFGRTTYRASYQAPRSLWEWLVQPTDLRGENGLAAGTLAKPKKDSHREETYQFSIPPWRWLELLWPNLGGRMFPQNENWLSWIPAQGRHWSPSLFIGSLASLLAVGALAGRERSSTVVRWLGVLAALCALLALGYYGLAWLANQLAFAVGYDLPLWSPVGGLYWLMTIVMPGFQLFRYPGKLWIFVQLAMALLAALGLRQLERRSDVGLLSRRWLWAYGCSSLGLTVIGLVTPPGKLASLASHPSVFGPVASDSLQRSLTTAGLYGLGVCLALTLIGRYAGFVTSTRWFAWSVVVITMAEIGWANAWMIATAPSPEGSSQAVTSLTTQADEAPDRPRPVLRYYRPEAADYPDEFYEHANENRLAQNLAWDVYTARPKLHLRWPLHAVHSYVSARSARHHVLLTAIADLDSQLDSQTDLQQRVLENLGTDAILNASGASWLTPRPRLEIVRNVIRRHDSASDTLPRLQSTAAEIIDRIGQADRRVLLESPDAVPPPLPADTGLNLTVEDQILVKQDRPERLVLDVNLRRPAYVIVRDSFAPGWSCQVATAGESETVDATIYIADMIARAIYLPEGRHTVHFSYQPPGYRLGLFCTVTGLIVCTGLMACVPFRRNRALKAQNC